jgi:hypothetical protein
VKNAGSGISEGRFKRFRRFRVQVKKVQGSGQEGSRRDA